MSSVKFHFLLPVWGKLYVEHFLHVSLPCQLSDGNLGFFGKEYGIHKYKIYTTKEDARIIQGSPVYSKLIRLIKTEIHYIDDIVDCFNSKKIHSLGAMTLSQSRGVIDANNENAAIVFLVADSIIADSTFKNIYKLAVAGKRAVIVGTYRVSAEKIIPELLRKFYSHDNHSICISSRELVRLSLNYLDMDDPLFVNEGWVLGKVWMVGREGMILSAGPRHPYMVYPAKKALLVPMEASKKLDFSQWNGAPTDSGDYVRQAVPDFEDVHVVEDSDEITVINLDTKMESASSTPSHPFWHKRRCSEGLNPLKMAYQMKISCYPYHFEYLKKKQRFHYKDFSPFWKKIEKEVDEFVNDIFACLDILDACTPTYTQNKNELRRRNIDDLFKLMDEMVKEGEELACGGQLGKANIIFSRMLDKVNEVKGNLINNLAVLRMEEGNLEIAEWLLDYLIKEGYRVDEAAANLEMVRNLLKQRRLTNVGEKGGVQA